MGFVMAWFKISVVVSQISMCLKIVEGVSFKMYFPGLQPRGSG